MRWTRIAIVCVLGLAPSCVDTHELISDDAFVGADGAGDETGVDFLTDGESPDLTAGTLELVEGHISTLGGPSSVSKEVLEGNPDFEVFDDGLEYAGIHGDQCSANKDYCITEGGIVP